MREAITFLERILIPEKTKVLEFGAGASTLWIARRSLRIDSVEHDQAWALKVKTEIARSKIENVSVHYGRPDNGYREYVELGKKVAKERGPFDLVLVDGRERVRCVEAVCASVKSGGYLVLDNAERPRYAEARKALSLWEIRETSNGIWRTDIFRKP